MKPLFLGLFLLASLARADHPVKAHLGELGAFAQAAAKKLDCPALAVGVVAGDELVWFQGSGARDLASAKEAPTKDTVFRIGSVTKTFTGAALLALRDDRKISLEDFLSKYVAEANALVPPTKDSPPITLRHLATHTSGLPRIGNFDYTREDAKITAETVVSSLPGLVLQSPPGLRESYSNLAFSLLGLVESKVAGVPYRVLVAQRLLTPLGLASAAWDRETVPADRLATGYEKRSGTFVATPHWRLGASEAAGGLYLSTADLAKWAIFQLSAWPPRDDDDKGPLRRATVRESQRAAAPLTPGPHQVGLPWQIDVDPVFGAVAWHNGGVGNYRSALFMLPQRGLAVTALCSSGDEDRLDGFASDLLLEAARRDRPALSPQLEKAYSAVLSQIAKPDAKVLATLFGTKFLASSPATEMKAFFAGVGERAGKCAPGELVSGDGVTGGKWRLKCEHATKDLLIHLDQAEAWRIDGLYVRPPSDP